MKLITRISLTSVFSAAALIASLWACSPSARANVFASNIKINGIQTGSAPATPGAVISYILNEPASAGVSIRIFSGAAVVRTLTIVGGSAGTLKGTNSVAWDGKDGGGVSAPPGSYSVTVTAAATGYSDWTQITDDAATNTYINAPYSIAVNSDTNSAYYGRIIVGNATATGSDGTSFGNVLGLYKFNADASYSDDGGGRFSTAGYVFRDDGGDVPIQMKFIEDGRIYFNDWFDAGKIVACDMLLTSNQTVLDAINYSSNPYASVNWINFNITDILTDHARAYMTDASFPSAGIWFWPMTNGVTDSSDAAYTSGYQAVATGGDLPLVANAISIDSQTNVYVMENRANPSDPTMRVGVFTNWDGQTTLSSGAAWVVGGSDDTFRNLRGMALDSVTNPKYLAVGMTAAGTPGVGGAIAGGIRILNTADGSTAVTNLDFRNYYRGVHWDKVGNLYGGGARAGGTTPQRWRIFSPPGANQATTPALATLLLTIPPRITNISVSGANVIINFTSDPADSAAAFTLLSSGTVNGTYSPASGAIITGSSGSYTATVPKSGPMQFYRIRK